MSIIKHVALQKVVAHDFRYDPRIFEFYCECRQDFCALTSLVQPSAVFCDSGLKGIFLEIPQHISYKPESTQNILTLFRSKSINETKRVPNTCEMFVFIYFLLHIEIALPYVNYTASIYRNIME